MASFDWPCVEHARHTTLTQLSHDYHTTVTQLSHNYHTTVTWLSHNCHTTITQLSHNYHTTVTWLSHDCHMTVTQLSHDYKWPPLTDLAWNWQPTYKLSLWGESQYCIAPNFCGTVFSWISWLTSRSRKFYSQNYRSRGLACVLKNGWGNIESQKRSRNFYHENLLYTKLH